MSDAAESKPSAGEIRDYLDALAMELNMRMVCESGLERIFWVEGITLISYEPGGQRQTKPKSRPAAGLDRASEYFRRQGKKILQFLKKHLPGSGRKVGT